MLPVGEQPRRRAAGTQVMPYSTGCCTPLSNFEAGLNYKDVSDPAVMARARRPLRCGAPGPQPACRSSPSPNRARGAHLLECRRAQVAFQLVDDPDNAEMIAWTTTPWRAPPPRHGPPCRLQGACCRGMAAPSARAARQGACTRAGALLGRWSRRACAGPRRTLPSNLALCVNPGFDYVRARDPASGRVFVVAAARLAEVPGAVPKAKKAKQGGAGGAPAPGWQARPGAPCAAHVHVPSRPAPSARRAAVQEPRRCELAGAAFRLGFSTVKHSL